MKRVLLLVVLHAVVSYPLWYTTYQRYNLEWGSPDSAHYIDLCWHLWDEPPETPETPPGQLPPICHTRPLRYRVLSPLLVRGLRRLELHRWYEPETYGDFSRDLQASVEGATGQVDPTEYRLTVYNFILLDYVLLVAAATVWTLYAYRDWQLPLGLSLAGGWAFLLLFYNVLQSYSPHADAGAHLLIVAGLMAYARRRVILFAALMVLAAFQKETILLVLGLYLVLELLRGQRRAVLWMLSMAPALIAYQAATRAWPAVGKDQFDVGAHWLTNLAHIVDPAQYTKSFVLRHFVGNAPLLTALAGHLYLRTRGQQVRFPLVLLLLVPALYVVGMALTVNVGRVISLSAALYLVYVMKVVERLLADAFAERSAAA